MDLSCNAINKRRSCRFFDANQKVSEDIINKLIYAASLAPSGKNTQPWRFRLLHNEQLIQIAEILPNNKLFSRADKAIAVYLDTVSGYDAEKDTMALGACIENILIEAESNGVATCWIGECTDYRAQINNILCINERYKLMAIIAVGYSRRENKKSDRYSIHDLMV